MVKATLGLVATSLVAWQLNEPMPSTVQAVVLLGNHTHDAAPMQPHSHWHRHEAMTHTHAHVPDLHHLHRHG